MTDYPLPLTAPPPNNPWPARVFVGGVWLVLTLGLLGYVFHYGSNVPFFDDWHMVPYVTGAKPVTLEWLWSQHGDHRVPLSRLLLLGLGKLCGNDFRCGMVFDVLALSVTSLALIATSSHLRGRLLWADAFFPLVLLNPGQWETYLWCWIASLTLPIALALIVLCILARCGVRPCARATVVAGVLILMLPLADSAGLAFVPALILWLLTAAIALRSAKRLLPLGFALAAVGLLAVYYIGYERQQGGEMRPSILAALRTTIEFMSMGIGQASVLVWSWSAMLVIGLVASTVVHLQRTYVEEPTDRSRVIGVGFFLLGALSLALALGWGRGGEGVNAGFKSRYVVMALPIPCVAYLSYGLRRGWPADMVQAVLCVLMFVLLPLNVITAFDGAHLFQPGMAAFERDLHAGHPPSLLAEEYTNVLFPWPVDAPDKQLVHERLLMLQRAGIGQYRDMAADVPFHEVSIQGVNQTYILAQPENVLAVRTRYTSASPQSVKVIVREPGTEEWTPAEVHAVPPLFGVPEVQEQIALAYVNRRIDRLRIEVDGSTPIAIDEIVLLVKDK